MLTVRTTPQKQSYPFYYKVLERSIMKQKINLVYVCNILLMLKSMKKASKNLIYISLMSLMYSGQHNIFNFLSFKKSLKLGARPVDRMYVVANFLMNVITSFYGNQFTSATGMSPPTLEEILRRAQ